MNKRIWIRLQLCNKLHVVLLFKMLKQFLENIKKFVSPILFKRLYGTSRRRHAAQHTHTYIYIRTYVYVYNIHTYKQKSEHSRYKRLLALPLRRRYTHIHRQTHKHIYTYIRHERVAEKTPNKLLYFYNFGISVFQWMRDDFIICWYNIRNMPSLFSK